ncbi:PIN domain nuclease of toxin-antitoxin system [Hoeflea marina]|uniref:PIN domain nuclease of toxin-antitoxin system n=1 Tax=Hoeflea marina TaxID=274592 RepID=A0A317PG62_9HYPH|nr:type II toxin-antitoxin system VapC family toxin [Hoeflea marina]PWV99035.1 PIN domain nuclease of toxin-antitoxin system [Hoeflea marina]
MKPVVLDASAILALAFREPGEERVTGVLSQAIVNAVNLSESAVKLIKKGFAPDEAINWLGAIGFEVVSFDTDHGWRASRLSADPANKRLSFADRACIATAERVGATALTTDRIWADLDLPCKVELIR